MNERISKKLLNNINLMFILKILKEILKQYFRLLIIVINKNAQKYFKYIMINIKLQLLQISIRKMKEGILSWQRKW